ncbi:ACP S-malonyltransferase [Serinibacter salmoneus]|uniref:[acyl-carrier-protein] S-malonyltransferase n=1 Tax=Serinibacter salmoneus TaxID=556530 RepID=A0A2A9D1V2_9MICO|nr:ACP S-malonyltransferase [Serinibacter salmoneus]PFG19830.1 [acyl-carrier-protein] S-malonyltransferase [Serinibacter salmoneus]
MLAILAPGQGAQSPGMLTPWLEIPGVAEEMATFGEAAGLDLTAHGTTSDADTIRDTAIAQPLLVATSLVALRALLAGRDAADVAGVTAGHSVGEFAAAAVAGVLTDASAVELVSQRARLMAEAAAANPSGMAAVLGGDPQEVTAAIEAAGAWPANVNGGGQVVAAGSHEAIAALAAQPPAKARVMPLQVAGAFHTPLMASAGEAFARVVEHWPAAPPRMRLLTNADGSAFLPHGEGVGNEVLARLAGQITSPVRWDLCQETMRALGVTGIIELAPGGVLSGLARRVLPDVPRVAIKSPADLESAAAMITDTTGER